jgi:RHS repeat-associated protein
MIIRSRSQAPTLILAANELRLCSTSFVTRIFVLLCGLCFTFSTAPAQNIQFTQGSVGSALDNTFHIPLRAYPGRGAASLPISLYYSSKVWRINHLKTITYGSYLPITEAIYAEHSTAGWKTSLDIPKVEWPKQTDGYFYTGKPYNFAAYPSANAFRVRRVYLHMPDGSTHELRENDQPYQGAIDMQGTFYAVDGSRLRYDSTGQNTGTLYLPDGSRYVLNTSTAQFIDRNGNSLNYDAATRQWTDTLGRVLGVPLPSNPVAQDYTYTLPGSPLPYTFRWRHLSETGVLTRVPDNANGVIPTRKPIANEYLPNPSQPPTPPSGGNYPVAIQTILTPRPSLFISDADEQGENYAVVVGHNQNGGELFNPVVLTEIVLPNGLSYKFSYNIYGEIDKVIYPTGAFERYTYGELPGIGDIQAPYVQANRGVVKRELSANGSGNDIAEWQYSVASRYQDINVPLNTLRVTTKAPDNTYTESDRQNFKAPQQSGRANPHFWPFGFEDAANGMVIETRVYAPNPDGTKGTMLRRSLTKWEKSEQDVQHRTALPGDEVEKAYRNARAAKEVSLILDTGGDALAKTLTYQYDTTYQLSTGLDLIASTESHFSSVAQTTAQTGAVDTISPGWGTLASTVETTYLNDAAYRDRNLLGLVTSVALRDANGQAVSKTETFYDEASYAVNIAGQATGWTDPATSVRGNATTSRRYIDLLSNLYLESHVSYDQWGNVRSTWDARGNQSRVDYVDSFSDGVNRNTFAYATSATTAVPDPTGSHGSNTAFTSSSTYDYATGLTVSSTDASGQTTHFSYRDEQNTLDPSLRLRKVTRPDGGWTRYSFNDMLGNLYTQTETQIDATRITTARQYFDAAGRSVRSFAYENTDPQAQWLGSDIYYDSMGRVSQVSSAYRTAAPSATLPASCTLCTSSAYDALGRVKSVTLPDNTTVQTSYQGVYTTVIDQAGKQRRQKTDALGRVVRVDEPDSTGNLGSVDAPTQATYYEYSTAGNLVHIQQGVGSQLQHRYFKYDALGRLTYERQVEQAAIFTATDPLTNNSQWSRKVVYDENGYQGLASRTIDARNIQTHYQYDNLNRIYQVSYSDGTPTLTNYYDQARTGYVNKGRLTEVQTSAVSAQGQMPAIPATSQVYDYDLMGRVARQQQVVGTYSYSLSYSYNLGGQLVSQTYPSGRVVNYGFDEAARLQSVTSGATTYASNFQYGTQGVLNSLSLGNGAVQTFSYNERLQLSSTALTKNNNVLQKYEYKYGKVNTDGTVDETQNNGQIARIEGSIGTQKQWQQRFSYDSLGRLSQASEYRGDNFQQSSLLNYSYDPFGNRYQSHSSNPQTLACTAVEDSDINKLTNRYTFSQISYDNAGNITIDSKFRGRQYSYDANGRQRWTARLDGTGATTDVYDGAGQRVASITNGTISSVLVYDALGKLVAEYGTPSSQTGGTQYVFADHQGSTRVTLNQAGGVIARHDYQPFGEEIYAGIGQRTTTQGYNQAESVRQKYAGMEQDESSGMSHTLWRKYDSQSGRWTTPDPYGGSMEIADPQSFNRYTYVQNDPVNLVDPLGLMEASAGWGSVANGFWGNDLMSERPWGGRDEIAHAEARHDSGVQEAMALKAFWKAWNKEDYDACRDILAANPSVGYEVTGSDIIVYSIEQLDGRSEGSDTLSKGHQDPNRMSKTDFVLPMTGVDITATPSEMFTFRIVFGAIGKDVEFDEGSVNVSQRERGRWRMVDKNTQEKYDIPAYRTVWGTNKASVYVTVRLHDMKAPNHPFSISIAGSSFSLYRRDGRVGTERPPISRTVNVRLLIENVRSTIKSVD